MTEQQIAKVDFEAYVATERKPATKQQIEAWHKDAVKVAAGYRRCEYRLVELLKNISQCEGYLQYKCDSLTRYARFCLHLPENTIRDFVTVANKAKEVPQIIDALKANKATVSKIRKVCPVLKSDDYEEWLGLVEECSTREIERVVAQQSQCKSQKLWLKIK